MIFVLDTNVISELMRRMPEPKVVDWIAVRSARELYSTAVAQAEILFGLHLLPVGRRRVETLGVVNRILSEKFDNRIVPFDAAAANEYAVIASSRRQIGRPIAPLYAQIAAIAEANDAVLVTRNVSDFEHCGIEIIDPWLD